MTLNPEIAASLRSIHEQLGDDFDASIGTSAPPVEDAPKGKKKRKNDRPKKEKKAAAAVAPAPRNKDGDHSPAVKVLAGAALVAVIGAAGFAALPHLAALMEDDAPPVLAALAPVGDPTQRFVIDGDTMYLEGSVPDQAISDSIESAAGAAIGQERVINNFEISDDAVFDPDQAVQLTVAETVQFRSGRADLSEQ